ncbi:WxL domain-containing protein [Embleya sp. MST-111070]|uniref:WxL domain-containing protein n=1 Tax=Embleya sp. MST-111070 TaxID=3398231 RepID=UPI003F738640
MFKANRQLAASLGVVTIAGTVGMVALAPGANAADVTYTSHCVNQIVPNLVIPDGDLKIDLSVAPAKARYDVGEEVTVTWTWKSYPKAPPEIPVVGKVDKDSTLPKGSVTLGGAATGAVAVEGQRINPETLPGQELVLTNMTGKVKLTQAGDVTLTPGLYSTFTKAFGLDAETKCNPVNTVAPSATLKVGAADKPVLNAPSTAVEPGSEVALTGSKFAPGAVTATLDGAAAGIASSTLTVDASGNLTGNVKLADNVANGAHTLAVADSEGNSGQAQLLVRKKVDPTQPGDLTQKLDGTITAGSLAITQQAGGIRMSDVSVSAQDQTMTGKLNTVTVSDLRGGNAGWTLTGSVTDFENAAGESIPADHFSWKPKAAKADEKSKGTPVAGSAGTIGSGATLASVPQGSTNTGGTFSADADIDLKVPAYQGAGDYSATLTLSIS